MPRDLPCQAMSIQSVLFTEGPGRGRSGGRGCRAANVTVGRAVSGHSARPARSGKPGSGTGARFAPIATTRCASSATAPRSTVPARAGSESGRPRPSCGPRLRRRISPVARCWTHDGSRTDSACSTTCSARLASRRDGSPLPAAHFGRAPKRRTRTCNDQPSPPASVLPRLRIARPMVARTGQNRRLRRRRRVGSSFALGRR
jgi:hypothetical protein